jgi:alpha-2-macroglobulin
MGLSWLSCSMAPGHDRYVLASGISVGGWVALLLLAVASGCREDAGFADPTHLKSDEVAVLAVHPVTGQLELDATVGVTFSRDLATASGMRPGDAVSNFGQWLPDVPGTWRWTTPDRLEFFPDGRYAPNTIHTLTIDPRIVQDAGLSFKGRRSFAFTSDPFTLTGVQLLRERMAGETQAYQILGTFSFNCPVNPADFSRHLSLELERRGQVHFDLVTTEVSDVISFHSGAIEVTEERELLTALLKSGLPAAQGSATLASATERQVEIPARQFLVVEKLQLESVVNARVVKIELSHAVEIAELRKVLSIDPPVEQLEVTGQGREVLIRGAWVQGCRYTVKIAPDLISADGFPLDGGFQGSVHVGDLPPSLEIAGEGNYLSLRGEQRIGVETVNVDRFTVELARVYANNLVPFLQQQDLRAERRNRWRDLNEVGEVLHQEEVETASRASNVKVVTPISLGEQLGQDPRGVFLLSVRADGQHGLVATKSVVATDLGILAKQTGQDLWVAVVSVRDLEPLAGITVEVLSYNNQSLARGSTDGEGFVAFPDLAATSRGAEPFLITAARAGDLGFLCLRDCRVPTGDLDVGGDAYTTRGYDAFLYADRDILRPGESVHVAWIIRDADRNAPESFPLTLRVRAPDGRQFSEARVSSGELGTGEFHLAFPDWAGTGMYRVNLCLDDQTALGTLDIYVEEFIPERMKVACDLSVDGELSHDGQPPVPSGQTVRVQARATTLFGPPAGGRQAKARAVFKRVPVAFDAYSGFSFGDVSGGSELPPIELGEQTTDSTGAARWDMELPAFSGLHGWVRAQIDVEVSELGGGRAVRAGHDLLVSPAEHQLGSRRVKQDRSDYSSPGQPIEFEAVLVDRNGQTLPDANVRVGVYQIRWRTVLRADSEGRYRYLSEAEETLVSEHRIALTEGINRFAVSVPEHGSYRLVLESSDQRAGSSLQFYVYGWGYAPWAMSEPEKVGIKLDQDTYRPGEEMHVQIEAPFTGLLLLSLESDRVLHRQWVRLESNSAAVRLQVPRTAGPNAYVVATLLRPQVTLDPHAPARAFGAVPFFLNRGAADLPVEVRVADVVRPAQQLVVGFRAPGLAPGAGAKVTVAAVDEGILQISGYTTPSPLDHFFRRRRLGVGSFDIWSQLLPEYEQVLRSSAAGGDGYEEAQEIRRRNLNPVGARRVQSVALWSGVVDGSREWREVTFDLPEFTGAVRVMVVASSGERFGSAEKLVRVRDQIVLSPNLPRFLAPGDEIQVPVQVYNSLTEDTESVRVTMTLSGPVELGAGSGSVQEIAVPSGEERVVCFYARAKDEIGQARFEFDAQAGSARTHATTEMAVRPPQPFETRVHTGVARQNEPASYVLSAAWYAGTAHATVSVSPLPISQFAAALPYVLRYPYGCAEQTTSRCFPLLYFGELARQLAPDEFGENDADYFINAGIDRLLAVQTSSGGFAFWPGGDARLVDPWVSVYVTHFLVEAKQAGYVIPGRALPDALGELKRILRRNVQDKGHPWAREQMLRAQAYAAFVLALAGEPEHGAMDYLARNESDQLDPATRAFLAGAYGLCGDPATMDAILPASLPAEPAQRRSGYAWCSAAADEALQLVVLAAAAPDHAHIPLLLARLGQRLDERTGCWHNTQENGLALLAVGKLIRLAATQPATGEILLDGNVISRFDENGTVLARDDLSGRKIDIRVDGPGTAYFSILDEGVPRHGFGSEGDTGVTIRREYLDGQGRPLDTTAIVQGEILVCRMSVSSQKGDVDNVVIADLVPAGLEIENPRLVGCSGPGRDASVLPIDYLDVRDDRLLLFTRISAETRVFSYGLRAVTAGSFVLPPVKVEAMYDPDVRSIRGAGHVTIVVP